MSGLTMGLRAKLLSVFALTTMLFVTAAAFTFWSFRGALIQFEDTLGELQTNAIAVVAMEADFKKQVQEWKDTLLRGKNPDALKKYWGNFQAREKDVRTQAEALARSVTDSEANDLVKRFSAAHEVMGGKYRQAFDKFKESNFDSAVGDSAVAGMDRLTCSPEMPSVLS